jgi:hypothetical protein
MAQEEFDAWLAHPITQQVLAAARLRKETFKERWAAGAFTDLSQYGTAILNAKAIGGLRDARLVDRARYENVARRLE